MSPISLIGFPWFYFVLLLVAPISYPPFHSYLLYSVPRITSFLNRFSFALVSCAESQFYSVLLHLSPVLFTTYSVSFLCILHIIRFSFSQCSELIRHSAFVAAEVASIHALALIISSRLHHLVLTHSAQFIEQWLSAARI